MTIEEINQLIKDLPEELFETPQYGKLNHTTFITKEVGTFFEAGGSCVVSRITTDPILVAQFNIYENMVFTYIIFVQNKNGLINTQISDVLNQIKSYLNILGFKEFVYGS